MENDRGNSFQDEHEEEDHETTTDEARSGFLFPSHDNMIGDDQSQNTAISEPDPQEARQRAERALQLANHATSPTYGRSSKRTPSAAAGESSYQQFGFSQRKNSTGITSPSALSPTSSFSYEPVVIDNHSQSQQGRNNTNATRIDQMMKTLPRKERLAIAQQQQSHQPKHPFQVIDEQYKDQKTSRMINTAKERCQVMLGCDSDVDDDGKGRSCLKMSVATFFVMVLLFMLVPFVLPDRNASPPPQQTPSSNDNPNSPTTTGDSSPEDPILWAEIMGSLRSFFLRHDIASKESFLDGTSPQSKALNWLSNTPLASSYNSNYQHDSHTSSQNWEQDKLLRPLVEQYSLAVLYYTTGDSYGDNVWTNQDGWLTAPPSEEEDNTHYHCEFYWGITCAPLYENDKQWNKMEVVVGLNLTYNNLQSSLPTELALLRNLESLELPYNSLEGPLPQELAFLDQLQYLDMGFNLLTGQLDDTLGETNMWSNLFMLGLNDNQFSGSIPSTLGTSLPLLEQLYLENNQFTSSVPESLGQLSDIVDIRMHKNQLSGELPNVLAAMTNLEILFMHENQLTGIFAALPIRLFETHKLTEMRFSDNRFSGSLPLYFFELPNLEYLHLSYNMFSGQLPPILGDAISLKELTLRENKLNGSIPSSIGNLVNLELLDLGENELTDVLPIEMGELINLESLYLENNRLQDLIPYKMGNLKNLQTLQLHWNAFSGHVPDEICDLTSNANGGGSLQIVTVDCAGGDAAALITCDCCSDCF